MRLHQKGWALFAAVALVVGFTSTAMAIESFQERFDWGDMSKPTTIEARVIVVDPYDKAVWLNTAIFGGNSESGFWWQTQHPGKNLKFYAKNAKVWGQLKSMARSGVGPAAARKIPAASKGTLVQIVATEPQQNYRVIHSVKKLREIAGKPGAEVSIAALRATNGACKSDFEAKCYKAKQKVATAPKAVPRMTYDVMLPGGKPIGGMIPWSGTYNTK